MIFFLCLKNIKNYWSKFVFVKLFYHYTIIYLNLILFLIFYIVLDVFKANNNLYDYNL